ncbi:MAG: sigma-70 family RNA polymerase sigma factor [Dysgonamonadaceae bacterium]|jgi:RNA polymerase sigma-70 factor (ECF subfamily)|nr:sigma-70 family RNA polymerase sigma factor [Dysgonamonadaceae bacterium]
MDDTTLSLNISQGDHSAFRLLMERYYGALWVFSNRILDDDFYAEDVVQDVFVDVWSQRKQLAEVVSVKSYLYGMVKNKCLTVIRSSKISEKYPCEFQHIEDDMLDKYIETETIRLLLNAVEALPPRSARVLKLSLEGLRQEKIAEQMGITVATVKALKAEGIKKLKKNLSLTLAINIIFAWLCAH